MDVRNRGKGKSRGSLLPLRSSHKVCMACIKGSSKLQRIRTSVDGQHFRVEMRGSVSHGHRVIKRHTDQLLLPSPPLPRSTQLTPPAAAPTSLQARLGFGTEWTEEIYYSIKRPTVGH